eukprot:TRINITY_DN2065_c0_g1_i10.p1 TRINITY_DN2065_c0_g1~~TRINITY_DN2065_c0_g1_i10.p1  ORF type:complete len:175 (+),score=2.43 TRINITY_DN2065_c0_g1_i10:258-782(+)
MPPPPCGPANPTTRRARNEADLCRHHHRGCSAFPCAQSLTAFSALFRSSSSSSSFGRAPSASLTSCLHHVDPFRLEDLREHLPLLRDMHSKTSSIEGLEEPGQARGVVVCVNLRRFLPMNVIAESSNRRVASGLRHSGPVTVTASRHSIIPMPRFFLCGDRIVASRENPLLHRH